MRKRNEINFYFTWRLSNTLSHKQNRCSVNTTKLSHFSCTIPCEKKKIRYCCIPYDEILSSTYEYVRKISHWRAPKVTRKTFLWLLLHVNQWINQEKRRIFIWRLSEMKPFHISSPIKKKQVKFFSKKTFLFPFKK